MRRGKYFKLVYLFCWDIGNGNKFFIRKKRIEKDNIFLVVRSKFSLLS